MKRYETEAPHGRHLSDGPMLDVKEDVEYLTRHSFYGVGAKTRLAGLQATSPADDGRSRVAAG